MERKNQICEAGQQYLDSMDEFQRYHTYPREAFIDGAKWADENPKESKQDIINNAKEFLRINFERGDDGYSCYYPDDLERLLWQFDLWMR
jgi:hypothetical protein